MGSQKKEQMGAWMHGRMDADGSMNAWRDKCGWEHG